MPNSEAGRLSGDARIYYIYTYIHLIAYFYDDSIHGFTAQPSEYQQNFRSHLTGVLDKSHFSIFNQ